MCKGCRLDSILIYVAPSFTHGYGSLEKLLVYSWLGGRSWFLYTECLFCVFCCFLPCILLVSIFLMASFFFFNIFNFIKKKKNINFNYSIIDCSNVQWTREVSASNRPQERNRDLCPLLTTTVIKIYICVYIVWKWCYQVGLNYIAVILSAHFSSSSSPAICVLPSNHVFIKRVPSPSIKTQNNQHKKEIQTNKSASVMEGASWLSWCPQELSNKLSTHNSL